MMDAPALLIAPAGIEENQVGIGQASTNITDLKMRA